MLVQGSPSPAPEMHFNFVVEDYTRAQADICPRASLPDEGFRQPLESEPLPPRAKSNEPKHRWAFSNLLLGSFPEFFESFAN